MHRNHKSLRIISYRPTGPSESRWFLRRAHHRPRHILFRVQAQSFLHLFEARAARSQVLLNDLLYVLPPMLVFAMLELLWGLLTFELQRRERRPARRL